MLTQARLKQLLAYDPETGTFTRLVRRSNAKAGSVAGSLREEYLVIGVDGVQYRAHRLAWLYMTGEWPRDQIDHKNGVTTDNRWTNLRDVSTSVNKQNMRRARVDNLSGLLGVSPNGEGFQARITIDGKSRSLGTYPTAQDAHAAYVDAKRSIHPGCTV